GHIRNWLLVIVSLFGVYVSCYTGYYVMVRQPWFTLNHDYFVSIGMCASILAIVFFSYGKEQIMNGFNIKESVSLMNIYLPFNPTTTIQPVIENKISTEQNHFRNIEDDDNLSYSLRESKTEQKNTPAGL